jgi:transcriptional regulator with XRE-family HTH domain
MASKAYLNALKEIPKEVQRDVIESIGIANEIHLVLEQKNLCAADLAKILNKSESEISKWLSGLHNFTYKTVRNISNALGVDLVLTKSCKIAEYEDKIELLQREINELTSKDDSNFGFHESLNFMISSVISEQENELENDNDRYLASFTPYTNSDQIKIKAETKSKLSFQVSKC